jgi:large subunit ribosomal protein L18
MKTGSKQRLAARRHLRVRKRIIGSAQRPRMSVCFTGQHIYVQFIDDEQGRTLAMATSRSAAAEPIHANVAGAKRLGRIAAEAAKAKGIERVVFDRGSCKYHGKVKALADAAREAGLQL